MQILNFIFGQLSFYVSLILVLFVPGYFFALAIFGKKKLLHPLEKLVFSLVLSIILVDFLMLFLDRVKIPLNRLSLVLGIGIISLASYVVYSYKKPSGAEKTGEKLFNFSKNQTYLLVLLFFLAVFARVLYLENYILPGTTDLGHHMYWAKTFAEKGTLANYEKKDILVENGTYSMSEPENISDFIIGEHLVFTAITLVSGMDVISYFPVLVLFLINIFSLLGLFLLTLRIFEDHPRGKTIAILTLFFIGPLFAIAPPQAKFVGGGVIGNVFGNLLMPAAFYFYFRFLRDNQKSFLLSALFISMGLFYTHHLTGLIFLMTMSLFVLSYSVFNFKNLFSEVRRWKKALFSKPILSFLFFAFVFVFLIHTPSYLTNRAVSSVVGEVAKVEHGGLTLGQFRVTVGELRIGLGLAAIFLFSLFYRKNVAALTLLGSWFFILFLASTKPTWLHLSIPSGRLANYETYPLSILSAFAFVEVFSLLRQKNTIIFSHSRKLIFGAFVVILLYLTFEGMNDNYQNMLPSGTPQKTNQTFHASLYLENKVSPNEMVVKDHIYLASDSWIKLFFMRDYNFPIYRANLERYENGIDRQEKCTLWMVSSPGTDGAKKCFSELNVHYVMVNEKFDSLQFAKDESFSRIYTNGEIGIYYRK